MYDRESRHGIKLYVRRVFIMDDAKQLLPNYLRFVRGVIDSNDLPLNVSREILQESKDIEAIRAGAVKKVLGLLDDLAQGEQEEEKAKFKTFWKEFGQVIKEGVAEDYANRERIAKLLRFVTTQSDLDDRGGAHRLASAAAAREAAGPEAETGLWAENLRQMQRDGLEESDILEVLRRVLVEPVLTAHPTEAKRETSRERHREIYSLMNRHENPAYTPREQTRLKRQLEVQLESLWRTGEIHVTRPTIEAELENALHYLREVFPEALARAHTHLREAWVSGGFDPEAVDALPPLVKFGTWIGGDRDGHPFVTAEVTRHALRALRAMRCGCNGAPWKSCRSRRR